MTAFQYKCRLCGEIYSDGYTSNKNAFNILVCTVSNTTMPKEFIGMQPTLVSIHCGCKKGSGISDLIGIIEEK